MVFNDQSVRLLGFYYFDCLVFGYLNGMFQNIGVRIMAHELIDLEELGLEFGLQDKDWKPTPHGLFMAKVLYDHDLIQGADVLELGAGVGIHTIILELKEAKSITATEVTQELLSTTRLNMEKNGYGSKTRFVVADWLNLEGNYDVIVANPPFARSGKQNRRYFIDELILNGHKRLREGGRLIFVQSSMADLQKSLQRLEENGFQTRIIDQTRGPFRDYYYQDASFMKETQKIPNSFEMVNDKEWETLSVLEAELQPYQPPAGAHIV